MKLLINAKLIRPEKCNVWNLLFYNGKANVPPQMKIICISGQELFASLSVLYNLQSYRVALSKAVKGPDPNKIRQALKVF